MPVKLAVIVLVCLSPVPAQVAIKAVSNTQLRVKAIVAEVSSGRSWSDSKTIPINQDLGTSRLLSAKAVSSVYPEVAVAQTGVSISASKLSATVTDTATSTFTGLLTKSEVLAI